MFFRVDHGGKIRMKPGLKKYAVGLTLDPNTVHRRLSLSEGNRKVELVDENQPTHLYYCSAVRSLPLLDTQRYCTEPVFPRSSNPVSLKAKSVPRWVLQAALNSEMMMDFTQWSPVVPAPVL
ncbi:hypothetical protein SRHO_G00032290 [Serrasalmus rhombeus]